MIKTWQQRCEEHPDHQQGIVTQQMIQDRMQEEIDELRQALAQSKQEPVAWMYVNDDGECEQIEYGEPFDDPSVTPLYTAPPKRAWVPLTDADLKEAKKACHGEGPSYRFAYWVEAICKEKNT